MKNWSLIILIGLAVIITIVLIFLPIGREYIFRTGQAVIEIASLPTGRDRNPEGMIPKNAGIFIRAHRLEEIWGEFIESEFFLKLKETKCWKDLQVENTLRNLQEEFFRKNGFEFNQSRIMELVGDELALAVLPGKEGNREVLMVVSRVGFKARLVEIMVRWNDDLQDEENEMLGEFDYRGDKIYSFIPTKSLPYFGAYTFIDNYLVCAISSDPVRSVIEEVLDLNRPGNSTGTLEKETNFALGHKEVLFPSESYLEWYLKPEVFNRPRDVGGGHPDKIPAIAWGREILKSFSGIKSASARIGYNRGVRFQIALKMEEGFVGDLDARPGSFRSNIPSGTLVFAESEIRPDLIWEKFYFFLTELARRDYRNPLHTLLRWEKDNGIDIAEDILPVLGDKISFCLEGISGDEFLPIPPVALIIKLKNPEPAERIMEKIAARSAYLYNLRLLREDVLGRKITIMEEATDDRFGIVKMLFLRPAYSFFNSGLIVSSSTQLLEKIIETGNGTENGLENVPGFKEILAEIGPGNWGLVYINAGELIKSIMNFAEWYLPIIELSRESHWLSEELYRETIVPVLNLCKIFKSIGISINFKKTLVKGECFLYID